MQTQLEKSKTVATSVVSKAEWLEARIALLIREKEFTRLRDEMSRERRELPWEKVEKQYTFQGPKGKESLAELFDGRSQLIVYHFMFGPGWKEGCPSCSFLADHFNPATVHLAQRDVTFLAISRATLPEIETFKRRMGGASSGYRHSEATSITTTRLHSRKSKSRRGVLSTTSRWELISRARNALVRACSTRMKPVKFSTPIRPTREDSIFLLGRTTSSI